MLQVDNHSAFVTGLTVLPDLDGVECAFAIIKATFEIGAAGASLAPDQTPITLVDDFWGDSASSSLRRASEISLLKPGTDILLNGHAYAPRGSARDAAVSLQVGRVRKTVAVIGNRTWKKTLRGYRPSDPEPFERIPLTYERAFGGTDPQPRDPGKVDFVPENPVGRGLVPRGSRQALEGIPLPNLEDPNRPIHRDDDRPNPACFAPICRHWEPRRSFAGTYDEHWVKRRAPYLPEDFDPRHLHCAPPDLTTKTPLKGGEVVEIIGGSPKGALRFTLPECAIHVVFEMDGCMEHRIAQLDTVTVEPDVGQFALLWRAKQVVDKRLLRLGSVDISCPQFPRVREV